MKFDGRSGQFPYYIPDSTLRVDVPILMELLGFYAVASPIPDAQ